jgi:hypothetical protein
VDRTAGTGPKGAHARNTAHFFDLAQLSEAFRPAVAPHRPVVKHGHTFTTVESFENVAKAISQCAHITSEMPVVLSLEVRADANPAFHARVCAHIVVCTIRPSAAFLAFDPPDMPDALQSGPPAQPREDDGPELRRDAFDSAPPARTALRTSRAHAWPATCSKISAEVSHTSQHLQGR